MLGIAVLTASCASAATIAEYHFTGGSTRSADRDPMSRADAIKLSAGFQRGEVGFSDDAFSDTFLRVDAPYSLADSVRFLQFRVSPRAGFTLNLTSLSFDFVDLGSDDLDNAFRLDFSVLAIVNGVATSLGGRDLLTRTANFTHLSLDINTPALRRATTPVGFRIFFGAATGGTYGLGLDNVVLHGRSTWAAKNAPSAVASIGATGVPEPAIAGLLGIGSVALFSARRRPRTSGL